MIYGQDWMRLGRLAPEEKVRLCMDMSDGCIRVCADGIIVGKPIVRVEINA